MANQENLTFMQRFARKLQDADFRNFCRDVRKQSEFDSDLKMVERVANIDVTGLTCNTELIQGQKRFSPQEIRESVISFFQMLDNFSPEGISLTDRLIENEKYLRCATDGKSRSYCKSEIDEKGIENKEIFVNLEGRIGDIGNIIHEFGHSFCEMFMSFEGQNDSSMAEIPTVILDKLSSKFLKNKFPGFYRNFNENEKFVQIQNVKKARECLMDAMLVKVVCGEETYDNVVQNYGRLFAEFPDLLPSRIHDIEEYNFQPMFEKKYIIPQAIATCLSERFDKQPEVVAKQLKYIIANNHKLTEKQTLEYLGLPNKDKLIEDYVANFSDRIIEIEDSKDNCANISNTKEEMSE